MTIAEELRMEGWQERRQEGWQEGWQEGFAIGVEKGELVGNIRGYQKFLKQEVLSKEELFQWTNEDLISKLTQLEKELF